MISTTDNLKFGCRQQQSFKIDTGSKNQNSKSRVNFFFVFLDSIFIELYDSGAFDGTKYKVHGLSELEQRGPLFASPWPPQSSKCYLLIKLINI